MKLRITKLPITMGVIAAVAMLAAFSACETQYVDTSKPKAELLSLKIVVGSGDLVMTGANIPAPVDNRDWVDEDYDLYGAEFKTISFKLDEDVDDAWFEPTVSPGAKVKWGVANRTVRPNEFKDTRVPATFDARDFIYFQVISADSEITNYYRFSTYMSSPVKELSSIKLAGRDGDMSTISPDEEWNGDLVSPGSIHITRGQAANAVIDAVPWAETSTLRYAKTTSANTEPDFGDNNTLSFGDGDYLYVEVAAENTLDKNIYLFRVYVGRIATVKTLTFKNPVREAETEGTGIFEALGKGTAKNYWSDNSGAGSFDSPHQPREGFTFAVELDEPEGIWQYAKVTGLPSGTTSPPHNNNGQPAWTTPDSNDATPVVRLEHNEYLAIKVIPPQRIGSSPDYFYKVKVGNLAAEFTVQPKSHWYKTGETADELEFVLDRTISRPTYQWYEANSWYGGYGFDSVGRIGGKGAIIADPNFGDDDEGEIDGIPYNVSAWHVETLDEKNNASLHNGGNQYYRLPTPGKPIPVADGGRSPRYRPKTDYKPFLASFSSETHYYWVEVTDLDTGLKAVSARAFVVTEWGQEWNLGQPQVDSETGAPLLVDKDHYIIDLYAYQTPGVKGLQGPPRNTIPFKDGNHRDENYIRVDFPDGFDIYDYSIFTAQALFYLADGRPWIQNWTQGDIGFARDGRDEDGNLTGEIEEIVLWYNLTNDNATRGLGSSGNEPAGGGLIEIPQYIVVKPAGTKPINRMPPFNPDGTPLNNGDAQGWFTPYIELCEVRFEGPKRVKPEE